MKKTILLGLLVSAGLMNAQHTPKYGLFAGVSFSRFSGSDAGGFTSRTGFHAGGFIWNYLSDKISIDVELAYSQMGSDFNASIPYRINEMDGPKSFTLNGHLKTDYLRLPVLFSYHPIDDLSVSLGPEIGILLRKELEYDQSINGSTKQKPDNLQQFDAGVRVKAQYIFAKHYLASAGYYLGMTKVYKNTEVYSFNSLTLQDAPKIYNSGFGISVGYVF
ncbi:porin family protein [Chryseobacterium sp.]|uniref:porin family protein n=1 Tax=Chryseobacterium sp. TaxID=1871047 RepID=UPI0025C633CA|nr:porin family protein [Chryseobacterium sp.]MBV8328711.1 PorT family protein [Chryseobacterium sp.]